MVMAIIWSSTNDHLQDVDMRKDVDRVVGYGNEDKNYDKVDGHIDLQGLLGSYKEYFR